MCTSCRGKKFNANFFVQSFSTTLRVMDVRAENRGRPHQKVRFPAAPVVGRNFSTPGHPGVRVRNVCGKSGPKSLCLCCFSSLIMVYAPLICYRTVICYHDPFVRISFSLSLQASLPGKSALYGPMPVKTETFRELWAPLVHTFLGKFVWTNGPGSSSKVSPYTGIGPWMALPVSSQKRVHSVVPLGRKTLPN